MAPLFVLGTPRWPACPRHGIVRVRARGHTGAPLEFLGRAIEGVPAAELKRLTDGKEKGAPQTAAPRISVPRRRGFNVIER